MEDYAGRVLADRYRLPLPPSDEYELTETRAFDTYSGQEVLVRQVPLPEVVEAEVLDAEGLPDGFTARDVRGVGGGRDHGAGRRAPARPSERRSGDPAVRRAVEAAQAAARIPDHPRLDQVFDVFADGGSLWIVSELVAARPLAALLAEKPLTPYRAAEVASDVLMALRVLHAHGWVHRNITARTVLVCDDGRVMLTGLAVGAAEEALCGYDPVPAEDGEGAGEAGTFGGGPTAGGPGAEGTDPEAARRAAIEARAAGGLPGPGGEPGGGGGAPRPAPRGALETGGDVRAARAGAIAAYRAGARAAARVQEAQQSGRATLPGARSAPEDGPAALANGAAQQPYPSGGGTTTSPPGRIADPYGVQATAWHGAGPRSGVGGAPTDENQDHAGLPRTGPRQPPSGLGAPRPDADSAATVNAPHPPTRWNDLVTGSGPGSGVGTGAEVGGGVGAGARVGASAHRGPTTALAAERARQARMAVVGPVTERWAPEQAGPVHENWQLAAPIGPATDLWALGALLFRAVQGHAPYPEDSTAELVQMVCAEPPAFAEECGPLRPVVESLLRQDPTERLDFEELRGWLRSLVRSAPEPEAGAHVVAAPPVDPNRLPIVRRRGELVRRRRAGLPAHHGRHKRAKREAAPSPRRLGRTLLVLVLLGMAAAIAYAMLFMPKADQSDGATADADRTGAAGQAEQATPEQTADASSEPRPDQTSPGSGNSPSEEAGSDETQTTGPDLPDGFTLRDDAAGFQVAVANGWDRTGKNGRGQVVYSHGDFDLIVVPGRDTADEYGSDPMVYQREHERELQPYRDSSWASSGGLKTIKVGQRSMAEGQFTWTDDQGRELFVRNVAMLIEGRYHVVQLRGPEAERDEVTRLFEQASATYQFTD
ncbi:protein kinase [Streptomyces sp. M41]|uniref:protein kinase n=1 Tax=Streptomyces sp. M41 TaxID=3059412 RepID=UPI00374DA725